MMTVSFHVPAAVGRCDRAEYLVSVPVGNRGGGGAHAARARAHPAPVGQGVAGADAAVAVDVAAVAVGVAAAAAAVAAVAVHGDVVGGGGRRGEAVSGAGTDLKVNERKFVRPLSY